MSKTEENKYKLKREKYLVNHVRGHKAGSDYISDLCAGTPGNPRRLIAHLLFSIMRSPKWQDDGKCYYVHIHHTLINKIGGMVTVNSLEEKGIVKVCRYYLKPDPEKGIKGITRRFSLQPHVLYEFIKRTWEDSSLTAYNIVTGKRTFARSTEHGNSKDYGKSHGRCYFHKSILLEEFHEVQRLSMAIPTDDNLKRFYNFASCVHTMTVDCTHHPDVGEAVYSYLPQYQRTITGRWYEIGGGAQGLPANGKICLNVSGFENYDMVAAQIRAELRLCSAVNSWISNERRVRSLMRSSSTPDQPFDGWRNFKIQKLDCAALNWWREATKDKKLELAASMGLSYSQIKDVLCATLMGAGRECIYGKIPSSSRAHVDIWLTDIRSHLRTCDHRLTKILSTLAKDWKYRRGTGLQEWARRVLDVRTCKDGLFVTNAAGSCVHIMDEDGGWIQDEGAKDWFPGRLRAFLLQGMEADFISRLVDELKVHGIETCSLQYDGVIVRGEIPKHILGKASQYSAMGKLAVMDSGPFKLRPKHNDQPLHITRTLAEIMYNYNVPPRQSVSHPKDSPLLQPCTQYASLEILLDFGIPFSLLTNPINPRYNLRI